MKILGYGEDALTLWAFQNELGNILHQLDDESKPDDCQIFFRPSFGRKGGNEKPEFGEFDFILLSKKRLYLGESKWDKSSRTKQRLIKLAEEQDLRHMVFLDYINKWFSSKTDSWTGFIEEAENGFESSEARKPLAPDGSLLAENLLTVLKKIKGHFGTLPEVQNVLLYLYKADEKKGIPDKGLKGFKVLYIDYSRDLFRNFIQLKL